MAFDGSMFGAGIPDEYSYGMGGVNPLGAGGSYNPALGLMMIQQPEKAAAALAAGGVPPPPPQGSTQEGPPLGAVMEPAAASEMSAASKTAGGGMGDFAKMMRGVAPPQAPQPQRLSSPPPPRPHGNIQSGQLMQLLQSLGAGNPNFSTRFR